MACRLPQISIHALREEGDAATLTLRAQIENFYPRPPRGGRPKRKILNDLKNDFYPRPPRGGRPVGCSRSYCFWFISIHALREEGDAQDGHSGHRKFQFLSTPSARRATGKGPAHRRRSAFLSTPSARRATRPASWPGVAGRISIHALREEGDKIPPQGGKLHYFYPRPPRGGRPHNQALCGDSAQFLSTPSARRATVQALPRPQPTAISIHALREEGDEREGVSGIKSLNFYPRPPRGGRHPLPTGQGVYCYFYPRPPRGGRRIIIIEL